MIFQDRQEAGKKLAEVLSQKGLISDKKNTIVLALPRGGVVVGAEISKAFNLPLDLVISRKIGAPGNPEFAVGAVGEKGPPILDLETISEYGISKEYLSREALNARVEIKRRRKLYLGNRKPVDIKNKTVIVTDDGIATGASIEAAIEEVKLAKPKEIILAIPVAPLESIAKLRGRVSQIICLAMPTPFFAVGNFYQIFDQVSDSEVIELLSSQ